MGRATISRALLAAALAVSVLAGCAETIPKEALQLSQESLEQRQTQSRRFDTTDEANLLSASAAVLQDLGFNIDESESQLGVLVGSKERDATESGQVAGAVIMAILFGVATPIDDEQKIRASIITRQYGEGGKWMTVRVTFQRVVWDTAGNISKSEGLNEPKLYQEFFEKLSKSVFLTAHEI